MCSGPSVNFDVLDYRCLNVAKLWKRSTCFNKWINLVSVGNKRHTYQIIYKK